MTEGVTSLLKNTLLLLGSIVILFFLDWRLALATLIVMPALIVATAMFRSRSTLAYRAVRERLGLVTATLAEDIAGMRVLQSFTREDPAMTNFQRGQRELPPGEPPHGRAQRRLLPDRRLPLVAPPRRSCSASAATSSRAAT